MPSGSLAGRTALVTGASRGIGKAIAEAVSAEGAHVVLVARSESDLREAAETSGGGLALVGDVGNPTDIDRVLGDLEVRGILVDLLVNNAGVVGPVGAFAGIDRDEWSDNLAINLLGPMRMTHALLPGMIERGYGRIVNISSGVAEMPGLPSGNAYSVSKAGLEMFSRNLATELEGTGVTCNVVRPGTVDTDMQVLAREQPASLVGDQFHDFFNGLAKDGRLISPEVPARLVVRILGSDMNGEVMRV